MSDVALLVAERLTLNSKLWNSSGLGEKKLQVLNCHTHTHTQNTEEKNYEPKGIGLKYSNFRILRFKEK